MGTRTELTLGLIGLLVMTGIGLIVWGQATGRLTIFGDTITPVTQPIIAPETLMSQTQQSEVTEEFTSSTAFDPASTLDWNIEAGVLTLPLGETTGSAQSLSIVQVTGETVRVHLSTEESRPAGSKIFYFLSPDGGTSWQPIFPERKIKFTNPTGDWRWRILMDRGVASTNPLVDRLTLKFTTLLQ